MSINPAVYDRYIQRQTRGNSMETYRIHDNRVAGSIQNGITNKAPPALPLIDIRLERFEAQVRILSELKKRTDAALNRVVGAGPPSSGQDSEERAEPNNSLAKLDIALEHNEYLLNGLAHQVCRLEAL